MPPTATTRAELRKRKGTDAPKAFSKKTKSARAANGPVAKEMAESGHEGSTAVPVSAAASAAARHEDLMGSSARGFGGAPTAGISDVAPFPSVLSEDSLSSGEAGAGGGSASALSSEEVASGRLGRPAKTPRLEESDTESDGHPHMPKMMRWRTPPKVFCV